MKNSISNQSKKVFQNARYICLTLALFFIAPTALFSQIERVIVETYYISDGFDSTDTDGGKLDSGSVTYRIYVDLKPGNKLLKIYGDANHALKFSSTLPFFNNIDGQTFGRDLKKGKYFNDTYALDTYLTLGQTAGILAGQTYFGILKAQDTDGSFIGGINNNGGSAGISNGLLTNTNAALGIPLTTADGMDTMATLPTSWSNFGIKDFSTQIDTTMFGSVKLKSQFISNNVFLQNSGVTGVKPNENQILIAQLTTKGALAFELNIEVEQLENNIPIVIKYVASDSILLAGEKKSSYLKYPFAQAVCGCLDPNYIEYNQNFECAENDSCKNLIVFGCTDIMACNFDARANFSIPSLCCYPGSCSGRDISVVCPQIRENYFEMNIYPNPAQSSVFLNVASGSKNTIYYKIYNSFGTLVAEKSLEETNLIVNYEIDISGFSNGLYLIKVEIGNEFLSKQFFKN